MTTTVDYTQTLRQECIQLLRNALKLAKINGLTRADIVKESNISNVTICSWLNGDSTPNILNLGRVINACGRQFKVSMK